MSLSRDEARELSALLDAVREEAATPVQSARLNELVVRSGEARQLYVEHALLAAALRWSLGSAEPAGGENAEAAGPLQRSTAGPSPADAPLERPTAPSLLGFLGDVIARVPGGEFVVGGLVLLAVTGAVWGVIHFTRGNRHATEQRMLASDPARPAGLGVGTLATDDRARWAQKSPAPTDATVRLGRRYELSSGCAKIELAHGTTVAIEGPAVWKVASDRRLELQSGRLLAYVPKTVVGFTVVTPTAEVVDLGTEFGVEVDREGHTDVHVLQGSVAVNAGSKGHAQQADPVAKLTAGQAVRVIAGQQSASSIPFDKVRFDAVRSAKVNAARRAQGFPENQPIWLGNLFDDRPRTPLAEAMRTDTFRAVPTFNNTLGVVRLLYAGSPVKEIAPGVSFDLTNLGWEDSAYAEAQVTNDAWYAGTSHADQNGARGGIRTRGKPMGHNEPRIEEGIGAHANALITFDLDEIRAAGGLAGRALEFRCDRAGINDARIGVAPDKPASVHMAAVVSNAEGVRQVFVDGRSVETSEHDHVWRVTQAIGEPLRTDGRFAEFQVSLPADAKWLTLLSASAGDGHFADHTVWSGARLEVKR